MRKHLRKISIITLAAFMLGSTISCDPKQVSTAKDVLQQATFYVDLANALIKVAQAQYINNQDVYSALKATEAALYVVKSAMSVADSGLDKDLEALKLAIVELAIQVFVLAKAIKEAKDSNPLNN